MGVGEVNTSFNGGVDLLIYTPHVIENVIKMLKVTSNFIHVDYYLKMKSGSTNALLTL